LEIAVLILIATSLLGILLVTLTFRFLYRARLLEKGSLKRALRRAIEALEEERGKKEAEDAAAAEEQGAVQGTDEPSAEEMREGLEELLWRIRWGIAIASGLFLLVLGGCITLFATGLTAWGMAMAGLAAFLAAVVASLVLILDLPRSLEKELD
jgi:hypothetical protein